MEEKKNLEIQDESLENVTGGVTILYRGEIPWLESFSGGDASTGNRVTDQNENS